jgi:hypothetical protein
LGGGEEKYIQGFIGETEGRRPLGRLRPRWEDNIKMDLREVAWGSMGWIDLVQDRKRWWVFLNGGINLRVP